MKSREEIEKFLNVYEQLLIEEKHNKEIRLYIESMGFRNALQWVLSD